MPKTLRVAAPLIALAVFAAGALTSCDFDTGNERCDAFPAPQVRALDKTTDDGDNNLGPYHFDCDPPAKVDTGSMGKIKYGHDTIYIWPDRIPIVDGDRMLLRVMWHETGHAVWYRAGEYPAEGYSYCRLAETVGTAGLWFDTTAQWSEGDAYGNRPTPWPPNCDDFPL